MLPNIRRTNPLINKNENINYILGGQVFEKYTHETSKHIFCFKNKLNQNTLKGWLSIIFTWLRDRPGCLANISLSVSVE